MTQMIYFAHTSRELAELSALVEKQAQDLGMATTDLEVQPGMTEAQLPEVARRSIVRASVVIALLGYGLSPIMEIEINYAVEADIPVNVFAPRPGSLIDLRLRRYAFGESEADRDAYEAFLERIQQHLSILYYEDEADLSKQVTQVLIRWQMQTAPERKSRLRGLVEQYADVLGGAAEAVPPPPPAPARESDAEESERALPPVSAPAPAVPAPSSKTAPERAREQAEPEAAPLPFDIDALAEAIAARTAANLRALQLEDQEEFARRAVEYADALRMRPGDLIFGRPNTASQFKSDAFMIMPFNAAFDGVYRSVVQPLFTELKLTVKRGDEFTSARGSIIGEVWAALNACRFVIADITGGNDNVFYELGIAHTLNKPTLLITQARTPDEVPFDLRHLRYVAYENTLAGADLLHTDLKHAVEWLLNELRETWEA